MKPSKQTQIHAKKVEELTTPNVTVYIGKALNLSDEQKSIIFEFTKFCDRALHLLERYKVYLVSSRKKYGIKTTGAFVDDSNEVWVYSEDRRLIDILRTISHEFVHAKQYEANRHYEPDFLHFSSRNEDEANYMSGAILNAFAEVVGEIVYEL